MTAEPAAATPQEGHTAAWWISLGLLVALALGLCVLPGFDVLGYYSWLALALAGGLMGGLTAAWDGVSRVAHGPPSARSCFVGAALDLWPHMVLPPALLAANAFRVLNCDLPEGVAFALIDPAPPSRVTFASGSQGGAYYDLARQYADHLAESDVEVEVLETTAIIYTSGEQTRLGLLCSHVFTATWLLRQITATITGNLHKCWTNATRTRRT